MKTVEVTFGAIDVQSTKIAVDIKRCHRCDPVCLYGVPRGGVYAAYAVKDKLTSFGINSILVEDHELAHVVIDDIVDSFKTQSKFTGLPFYALFNKSELGTLGTFYKFPWEINEVDGEDIATRLLQVIGEDPTREGLIETPKRFINAWKEWTSGYSQDPATVLKTFEDGADGYDEMIVLDGVPFTSSCEHHLSPFLGKAYIAYIPGNKIVGISKLARLVDIFARRLQVQERLTVQIADCLMNNLNPRGVGVVLKCKHLCMETRGVNKTGMILTTSALKGLFLEEGKARNEFLQLVSNNS